MEVLQAIIFSMSTMIISAGSNLTKTGTSPGLETFSNTDLSPW